MNNKIVALDNFITDTTCRAPISGSIYGEVVPFDRSFVDNDNISANSNLEVMMKILNLDSTLSASTKIIIEFIINALIHHYSKIGQDNNAIFIDDEVTNIISAVNANSSNSTTIFENEIYPLFFKMCASLEGVPLSRYNIDNEMLSNFNSLIPRIQMQGNMLSKSDILTACSRILDFSFLTLFPISDVEMILETEKLKLSETHFFLRTNISTFLNSYLVKYFYDNPFFRGTITPIIDNSHGTIDHQDAGKIIIELSDDIHLPSYIRINTDNNNYAKIWSSSSQEAKLSPQINKDEKGPISDICSFKEGKNRIFMKITADKDGELKAPSFFSAGLIRLEFLHRMIAQQHTEAGNFCAKHYKLLFEHLVDLYKGRHGTHTFRLTEATQEKNINGINIDEGNESLDYLLNTKQGRSILKMDIELILRLKNKGFEVELLVPNVASLNEIMEVKKIIAEVQEMLKKSKIEVTSIPIGVMVENPLIFQDLVNIEKEVDFFSIGINDMTNTYDALRRIYPEIFNTNGVLDISKLTPAMVKVAANRKDEKNKSARDVFLTSDFINFLKSNLFDSVTVSRKLRACGNIDKYIAAILAGMKVATLSSNHYELENIYFFLKSINMKDVHELLTKIHGSTGYSNSQEIQEMLRSISE